MSYCQDAYIEALRKENAALKEHAMEGADLTSALTLENHELRTIVEQYKEKEYQSKNKLVINVQTEGIDEALKKMKELAGIYEKVDTLQQRIIKGQEKINCMPYRPVESVQLHVGESIISKKGYEEIQKRIHEEILKSLGGPKRFGV